MFSVSLRGLSCVLTHDRASGGYDAMILRV